MLPSAGWKACRVKYSVGGRKMENTGGGAAEGGGGLEGGGLEGGGGLEEGGGGALPPDHIALFTISVLVIG